jgi:hypothetical protein
MSAKMAHFTMNSPSSKQALLIVFFLPCPYHCRAEYLRFLSANFSASRLKDHTKHDAAAVHRRTGNRKQKPEIVNGQL